MKIVYGLDGDETVPVVDFVDQHTNVAEYLKATPGVNMRYLAFTEIDDPIEASIAWDPTSAPRVSDDVSVNQVNIDAMLASPPLDKIWQA
jgi:hypothetical protein